MIKPSISGDEWPTFVCSYRHKGSRWGFEIKAENFEDAEARLASIHFNGKIDGELAGVIPVNPATVGLVGLYVKTLVWFRNLIRQEER